MKPTRILIADDHPLMCAGLAALITANGPDWEICATAGSGHEAVIKAVELRPDIIIMDYKMPLVNGLEAARQIKERLPGIEVLLLSGTPSPYILREMFCSDVGGCLLKSEPSEELMPALESLRAHRNFRSRRITELYREISQSAGKFQKISPQEMKILRLIVDRKSSKEIAAEMFVTLSTVEAHRRNLFRKLKLRSAVELVLYALRHGLVEL